MVKIREILVFVMAVLLVPVAALAQQEDADGLPGLLAQLADPATEDWQRVEDQVIDLWSRSGSRSADLLLQRGRDALEEDDYRAAIEHLTALTDHAPDFAEGWNMRATAFYLIGELGLAVEDIGRALALNPQHFGALNGLGIILEQLGRDEEAMVAYRAAHALNPHRDNVGDAIDRLQKAVDGVDI